MLQRRFLGMDRPRRPLTSLPVQAGVGASAEAGGGVNLGGQPRPSWAHARQAHATATLGWLTPRWAG